MYLIDNKLPSIQLNQNKIVLPSISNLNLPVNLPLPYKNFDLISQGANNSQSNSSSVSVNSNVNSVSNSGAGVGSYSLTSSPISPISPTFKNEINLPKLPIQNSNEGNHNVNEVNHNGNEINHVNESGVNENENENSVNDNTVNENVNDSGDLTLNSSNSWKPRKKRQCPECKLFFSNLATHKSTHLNPNSRPHICKYCSRGFARPNDLFRHVKCHWKEIGVDKGQFKCPYKNHLSGDHCGHNSGIFSRCDTFKNHLKAIHFQYPNGTRKDQRFKTSGNCRMCKKEFKSVDDWLINHLEKNQCEFANEFKK